MEERKVYNVTEIGSMLGISKNTAYSYVEEIYRQNLSDASHAPFRVIRAGKQYLIPKASFHKYMGMD